MESRSIDFAKTASIDMMSLNNKIVNMRQVVKRAKVQVINKLCRQIKDLKKKKGTEEQKTKNLQKAERLIEEIDSMKKLKEDKVSKYALANTTSFEEISKATIKAGPRALARLSAHPLMVKKVDDFRQQHQDWRDLAAYLLVKQTGRRFKTKKQKQIKLAQSVENIEASETMTKAYIQERFGEEGLKKAEQRFEWKRKRQRPLPKQDNQGSESKDEGSKGVMGEGEKVVHSHGRSDGNSEDSAFSDVQSDDENLVEGKTLESNSSMNVGEIMTSSLTVDDTKESNDEDVDESEDENGAEDDDEGGDEEGKEEEEEGKEEEEEGEEEDEEEEDSSEDDESDSGEVKKPQLVTKPEKSLLPSKGNASKPEIMKSNTAPKDGKKLKQSESVIRELNLEEIAGEDIDDGDSSDSDTGDTGSRVSESRTSGEEANSSEEADDSHNEVTSSSKQKMKVKKSKEVIASTLLTGKKKHDEKEKDIPDLLLHRSSVKKFRKDPFFEASGDESDGSSNDELEVPMDNASDIAHTSQSQDSYGASTFKGRNFDSMFHNPWSDGEEEKSLKNRRGGGGRGGRGDFHLNRNKNYSRDGFKSFKRGSRFDSPRGMRGRGSDRGGRGRGDHSRTYSRNNRDSSSVWEKPRDRGFQEGTTRNDKYASSVEGAKTQTAPKEKLHPSWEASRKRKAEQSGLVAFKGSKKTFDDD
ncbi:serum response factor-binding protein 1 [Aplysia californica]|uniref:Serum response factor-binding protein 1 n=1 Tax=Aplysia californica TaxID=6500 RepID=A0ABM0JQ38_APLCA|nr:serum response factor-binding protein 1 [Aplysia californica]